MRYLDKTKYYHKKNRLNSRIYEYTDWDKIYENLDEKIHINFMNECFKDWNKPKEGTSSMLNTRLKTDYISLEQGILYLENIIKEEQDEDIRIEKIWDKHYRKYKLGYNRNIIE